MKTKKLKKTLLVILGVLAAVLLTAAAALVILFRHELKTISTIEKVDDNVLYSMVYDGDYGFDDFLEQGAENDAQLIDFVTKKLLKGLPVKFSVPDLGCSTFRAQLENKDQVFGRNFDLTYSPAMIVKTKPKNGYASISVNNLAFLGFGEEKLPDSMMKQITTLATPYTPLDGMNEMGVCMAVLRIADEPTNQNTDKIDITTTTAVRLVLDKAASVDEALELLGSYDMHSSANSCYHFQIADSGGNSAIVEYIDGEMVILKQEKNYQAATNFLLSDKKFNFGSGQDRYEILDTELNAGNGVLTDEKAAMDLLEAVSQEWHETDAGKMSATQWSVVYNMTKKTASVVVGMQYEKEPHIFTLDEW